MEKDKFSVSVFPIGKRYVDQFNSFFLDHFPWDDVDIFCLTNLPEKIKRKKNIHIININKYDDRYKGEYQENYWSFDFNLKRHSIKESFDYGYRRNIFFDVDHKILIDDKEKISGLFKRGLITGFSFSQAKMEEKVRIKRFNETFPVFKKGESVNILEDSGVFFDLSLEKFLEFYENWDKLVKTNLYKELTHPRGVLHEISMAAKMSNIQIEDSGQAQWFRSVSDKWYV